MPDTNISSAVSSTDQHVDYEVDPAVTDGISDQPETPWQMQNWSQNLGYFQAVAPVNQAINAKSTWTVGKGFKSDEITTMLLDTIKGWGNDTFNVILENMIRTYHIGGDSFSEVIRDDEDNLINIKTLDPETIVVIISGKGVIKRYEQPSKVRGKKPKKFKTEQIFHLSRNRVADNTHGTSSIDSVKDIILMREEAMNDWKRVLHRNIEPVWIYHMDTDDPTKIAAFKTKMDKARGTGENMYVPKDVIVPEQISTATNATLNPLAWIENLNKYIFQGFGVPQFIVGGGTGFTEASEKIAYLAYQQTIEEEQLYIEEQVLSQLNLVIELEFPASLENELLSDKKKDGAENIQPNETTAGQGQ